MKIDRLYKLSQFVDYVTNNARITDDSLIYIKEYNDFLKQPIKKEMFVNDILCPDAQDYNTESEYETDLKAWEEAENKVIFKGWKTWVDGNNVHFAKGSYKIEFRVNTIIGDYVRVNKHRCYSMNDLAKATNGELEIINLEL